MQQIRIQLLEQLSARLTNWNGASQTAAAIIAESQTEFDQLKRLDQQLAQPYTVQEQKLARQIIEQQAALVTKIKAEQKDLLNQMKQMKQKDKVIRNYYPSVKQPVFLDKGL